MGQVTIYFLGEEYQVSEAINEFLHYDELLTPIRIKMINTLSQDIKTDSRGLTFGEHTVRNVDDNAKVYIKLMEEGANVLINKLFALGVYDVTVNELMSNMTCIEDMNKVRMDTLQYMLAEGRRYVELKNAGMERAYHCAASNITGSGVMIFTTSITNLLIHSMVERSILMKQAKQADREYEEAVRAINASTRNALDSMVSTVMIKQYYPAVMNILMEFNSKIMSAFLVELVQHGKFDFDSVQQYNLEKATQMLSNIDRAPDKVAFMKQAFCVCPYNFDIYKTALKMGLMDTGTYETAKYFGFSEALSDDIIAFFMASKHNPPQQEMALQLYMHHFNVSEQQAFETLYKNESQLIELASEGINKALEDNKALATWIFNNICTTADAFIKLNMYQLYDKAHSYLTRVFDSHLICKLTEMGILSIDMFQIDGIVTPDFTVTIKEMESKLVERLYWCSKEAQKLYAEYQSAAERQNDSIRNIKRAIDDLTARRARAGLFQLGLKKQLDAEIADKYKEMDMAKNDKTVADKQRRFDMLALE